jgi:hypothetical protein
MRLIMLTALTALVLGPGLGPDLLERVGSWPGFTRGPASEVAVAGHYAYVAIGEGGLLVLDVADPARPVRVGSYLPGGRTEHVQVVGSRAYLGTLVHRGGGCEREAWRGYLVILDVSDPANPAPLGSYMTAYAIESLCVDGNQVYLGNGEPDGHQFSFCIVDVSNPARPVLLNADYTFSPIALWAGGGRAYVARWSGLEVLDVSQPASPTVVTNVESEVGGRISGIQGVSNRLYVVQGDFGEPNSGYLTICDVGMGAIPVR